MGAIARTQILGRRFLEVASGGCRSGAAGSRSVYLPHGLHLPYPPSFAPLAAPVALVPLRTARLVWYLGQLALLALVFSMLARLGRDLLPGWPRHGNLILFLVLLLAGRYVLRDTAGGQTNLVTFFFCLASLYLTHRGRPWSAGASVGLACAIKVTPLLLATWLAWRGGWRAALGCLAALGLTMLPWLAAPDALAASAHHWASNAARFASTEDLYRTRLIEFDFGNQALRNAVFRYLTRLPGEGPPGYVNLLDLPHHTARLAGVVAGLVLVVVALLCLRRGAPPLRSIRFMAEASVMLLLMLLLSPITWKAHLVFLILPLFVILGATFETGWAPARRGLLWFWLTCSAASHFTLGRALEDLHLSFYFHTLGMLVLLVLLLALVRKRVNFSNHGT